MAHDLKYLQKIALNNKVVEGCLALAVKSFLLFCLQMNKIEKDELFH